MRAATVGIAVLMAVLLPRMSNAQAYTYATQAPEVNAAAAEWQIVSAPIMVDGLVYFPTRAFRLFDANVMTQTGVYGGVPIYSDVTLEPYSMVYVPVSASNMRVYERRREGALAGTTASRTPSFPVDIASDTVLERARREAELRIVANAAATSIAALGANVSPAAIATSGTSTPAAPVQGTSTAATTGVDRVRGGPTRIEMIPRPAAAGPEGVWLVFKGARWYSAGAAVPFSPERFQPIGEYRGFPVYRDPRGAKNEIWVSVEKDGPVAPYTIR